MTQTTTELRLAQAQVGVLVGSVVTSLQPEGAVKGSSGQLLLTGVGLDALVSGTLTLSNSAVTATGVVLGAATSNAQGTQVTVPFDVAANAASAQYKLTLVTPAGPVLFSSAVANQFAVVEQPTISSITPTVMQRGKTYVLEVRGSNLQNVRSIALEKASGPVSGVTFEANALTVVTDSLGDKLSVRIVLNAGTPLGPLFLRLLHAGGATSSQAGTANTINIVNP